jgi:transcriptional regulator with XRE-family HTH domain
MIGERIRKRLRAMNMSQAELARRTELHQSSVNQLITGKSRSSAHLHRIARALGTTTEFLEGVTDDDSVDAVSAYLTEEEVGWNELLRAMVPNDREALLTLARSLARSARTPTVHSSQQDYRAG